MDASCCGAAFKPSFLVLKTCIHPLFSAISKFIVFAVDIFTIKLNIAKLTGIFTNLSLLNIMSLFSSKPRILGATLAVGLFSFVSAQNADAQSILYICGNEKGFAGEAFDHGLIDYLETTYSGGTVTPTLSSDTPTGMTSAQGLYDPEDPAVAQTFSFNDFDCVVLSSTVSTHFVTQLMTDLNASSTNILVMSEESLVPLRMVENTVSFMESATSVFDGVSQVEITNYPGESLLSYGTNYFPEAEVFASKDAASDAAGEEGFFFTYEAGETVDLNDPFTFVGDRTFFGLSEGTNPGGSPSGVWEDLNGNNMVDDAENFDPNVHLTADGKALLDQALAIHVVPETGTTMLSMMTILLIGARRRRS